MTAVTNPIRQVKPQISRTIQRNSVTIQPIGPRIGLRAARFLRGFATFFFAGFALPYRLSATSGDFPRFF